MSDIKKTEDMSVDAVIEKYSLPKEWNIDQNGATALMITAMMSQNQYSRLTSIPMICKGHDCPYYSTCGKSLEAAGIDVEKLRGQRCPFEIQFVIEKFNKYKDELDIDPEAEIDLSLVKELVDIDIMIRRAELKMAEEGDFVEEVPVSINMKGQVINRKELTKAVEMKDKMIRKKHETLQLLNATRKDKAGSKLTITMDPSSYAAMLLEKKKELDALQKVDEKIIDTEYQEADE
ncbi:MAG TPA: hypothetical protein VK190_03300 [Pseudoneobacillus sp.]|jgi:hypothetical protein|nr:hypothetical protein [Pseudoneobacillus sp.]